jgi:DNA-binding CsgD family transcriptional regulator
MQWIKYGLSGFIIGAGLIYYAAPGIMPQEGNPAQQTTEQAPTVEEAAAFMAGIEAEYEATVEFDSRLYWVNSTYITEDTDWLASRIDAASKERDLKNADLAVRFNDLELPDGLERKMEDLRRFVLPAPNDKDKILEMTEAATEIASTYNRGKYCKDGECQYLEELSETMRTSRDADELLDAIKCVMRGQKYIGSEAAKQMALSMLPGMTESPFEGLSAREMEVMLKLTDGRRIPDIATLMCLSPKTVSTYKYRILDKLGARSDVEMVRMAMRYGLLETA